MVDPVSKRQAAMAEQAARHSVNGKAKRTIARVSEAIVDLAQTQRGDEKIEPSEYQRQNFNPEGKKPVPDNAGSVSPPDAQRSSDIQVTVRLVDIDEMARILAVPKSWLYQRTRLGTDVIPFVRCGKYLRFEPEKVVAHLKNQSE